MPRGCSSAIVSSSELVNGLIPLARREGIFVDKESRYVKGGKMRLMDEADGDRMVGTVALWLVKPYVCVLKRYVPLAPCCPPPSNSHHILEVAGKCRDLHYYRAL